MSIFKKITSLLFEESDVDVLAEDELEEVSIKEKSVVKEPQREEVSKPMYEPVKEPVVKPSVVVEEKKEPKKFVSINISEEPVVSTVKTEETKTSTHIHTPKSDHKEYEYSPVISPIFGAKDEVVTKKTTSKATITIPRAKKKTNPLGTIISPYFGVNELEEFEAKAQQEIEEEALVRKAEREEATELSDTNENDTLQIMEEELSSVSLEELLSTDVRDIDSDDVMQISLFGESTPITEVDHNDDTDTTLE